MPIVFDHVEGVVQRAPEHDPDQANAVTMAAPQPKDAEHIALELERLRERAERLLAD